MNIDLTDAQAARFARALADSSALLATIPELVQALGDLLERHVKVVNSTSRWRHVESEPEVIAARVILAKVEVVASVAAAAP